MGSGEGHFLKSCKILQHVYELMSKRGKSSSRQEGLESSTHVNKDSSLIVMTLRQSMRARILRHW